MRPPPCDEARRVRTVSHCREVKPLSRRVRGECRQPVQREMLLRDACLPLCAPVRPWQSHGPMRETDLYPPVKAFLEAQGYVVKAEVEGCDVVAVRGEEPPVIVELKAVFSLALVFQGIARQGVSDNVYLAVPPFARRTGRRKDALALCRRLGLGLLTVRLEPAPFVEALLDPAEYRPRPRRDRLGRLLREFQRRVGDPNQGGSSRRGIMTAYRQDALRCAAYLGANGPTKAAVVARAVGVARAGVMMRVDHYGWFERAPGTPPGVYGLTPKGRTALDEHAGVVAAL